MKNLKLIALLIIIVTTSSTAFTQNFSSDTTKCFSIDQVKKITAAIQKGVVCDSIAKNQQLQIINFKDVLKTSNKQIELIEWKLSNTTKELDKTYLKLKISTTLNKYGLPAALIGGFIAGIIISK